MEGKGLKLHGGGFLSANARKILLSRYILKDEKGQPLEDEEGLFLRVAGAVAHAEPDEGLRLRWKEEFYRILASLKFLPNSPTLKGAGIPNLSLSACYVIPFEEDSLDGIFSAIINAVKVQRSGGGTGFDFDVLRPAGSLVRGTGGESSGPISFLRCTAEWMFRITQGSVRMGANMGMLSYWHPDVTHAWYDKDDGEGLIDFKCVNYAAYLSTFNVSVKVDADFFKLIEKDGNVEFRHPSWGKHGSMSARRMMDRIVRRAWECGDPGLAWIDRMNDPRGNPFGMNDPVRATNPCAEQALHGFDACNLGSINLAAHVSSSGSIDYDDLETTVRSVVRFLDNVISVNYYPVQKISDKVAKHRRIGVGPMGLHTAMIACGVRYDSDAGIAFIKDVLGFIQRISLDESFALAKERGSFPRHEESLWNGGVLEEEDAELIKKHRVPAPRNSVRTTSAPTGTLSTLAGVSSGVEPIYSVSYARETLFKHDKATTTLFHVDSLFEKIAREESFWRDDLPEAISKNGGSLRGVQGIPEKWQRLFCGAHDVSPEWHVRILAAAQSCVDNSISKTLNVRRNATEVDIRNTFDLCNELGVKAATVFRDGCREHQVLNVAGGPEVKPEISKGWKRPKELVAIVRRETVGHIDHLGRHEQKKIFITVSYEMPPGRADKIRNQLRKAGTPIEVFATSSVFDPRTVATIGVITKGMSKRAQTGQDILEEAKMLQEALPDGTVGYDDGYVNDGLIKAIGNAVAGRPYNQGGSVTKVEHLGNEARMPCPYCGAFGYQLIEEDGCVYFSCCRKSPICGG